MDNQTPVVKPQVPIEPGKTHMFQINFYRTYFDLNTEDFFIKIKNALNPLNRASSLVETEDSDDDATELYGFIWITGTLIFLMFVSSTGSNMLSHWLHSTDDKKGKYEYNFDLLTISISLFYGYNLLVPFALYAATSWLLKFPHRLSLTKLISIYGYTNILWVPITVINFLIVLLINNDSHHTILNILEWIIVILSGSITGLSNLSKISPVLQKNALLVHENDPDQSKKLHLSLMILLGIAHLIFTIIVKISFFGISV